MYFFQLIYYNFGGSDLCIHDSFQTDSTYYDCFYETHLINFIDTKYHLCGRTINVLAASYHGGKILIMDNEYLKETNCSGDCSDCGSDCEENAFDQPTIVLTLDDDTEITCAIITIYPVEDKEYIALLPLDENGENEDGEVFLYRYYESENGQPQLENISEDDEYIAAATAFDALMETEEEDALEDEDED